jgi:hypothetical protein
VSNICLKTITTSVYSDVLKGKFLSSVNDLLFLFKTVIVSQTFDLVNVITSFNQNVVNFEQTFSKVKSKLILLYDVFFMFIYLFIIN